MTRTPGGPSTGAAAGTPAHTTTAGLHPSAVQHEPAGAAGPAGIAKPGAVFDRDGAWDALVGFATDRGPGPRLGVVSGGLRQGKTHLLRALTDATGGFLFCADDAVEAESLRRLGDLLARRTGSVEAGRLRDWTEAVDALLALAGQEPVPVVLDEFPRLVRQSPSLPAVLHAAFRRHADGPHGGAAPGRARLLLSGSDRPVMRRLFCGPSALRELVTLDVAVGPFGYREAARFWGLDDARLALRVHAVVGGTPAYRHAFVADRVPAGPDDFDAWVCGTVLDPRTPLFHEAPRLVHEAADSGNRGLCHSVLAAVALGAGTPGGVADRVGAPLGEVSHTLALLRDWALLHGEPDVLRPPLTRLRIPEPLLAFEHAVVRPHRALLDGAPERAEEVWAQARPVFESTVAPARFAEVCRDWVRDHAAPDTFGAPAGRVGHGSLAGPGEPGAEVVVRGEGAGGRPGPLLSVGLARWGEIVDVHHLERLHRLVGLLDERGEDVARVVPALYGSAGFGPAVRTSEAQGDVVLVGPDRLYAGG
ncbi:MULTISPECIES: AAA family ATPase [unclassified Streptomyces]|uniref:AAA family ATPase n=1 Tax=unclassified Streptomyces TaxID=2593676 RepID=UPI000A995DD0|nr:MULTISPECIES: ArsR family transcriptional regulator [unclassified Streptomyces]